MLVNMDVVIYSDGSCHPNPGRGGWAAVLSYGRAERVLYGWEAETTNNRMEVVAALSALEVLKRPCSVVLYSDSQYLVSGITKWVAGWQRRGWRTKSGLVANRDLWERLLVLNSSHDVDWRWIRGHNGDPGNTRVDELAVRARLNRISC